MDLLIFEESVNILSEYTQPLCFGELLYQVSNQLSIESHFIRDVLWTFVTNSPSILTSSVSDTPNDDALHLLSNEIRFRRMNLYLYESLIKNSQRIRVLLAIARRKYDGYWQSELSSSLSIDPKTLFQLLQVLCKQQLIIKLNMPFYLKCGSDDKMCFSTSSASSNSILFHHKYFIFDKFPEHIKVQMTNFSLDLFGDTLLEFINESPANIVLESNALNYFINLASSSAVKLCVAINPKTAEKGFNTLVNFLIEQSKITKALCFCNDTNKYELVLVSSTCPYLRLENDFNANYLKSSHKYQLNSKLTLPEQICKLIFLNGNEGMMATEICQTLSIRLKPLTKILNHLSPTCLKKVPERSGKLFYYRYYLSDKLVSSLPHYAQLKELQHNSSNVYNTVDDENDEFIRWVRANLDQLSLLVREVKGKMNTLQFRGRIAMILEYLKRNKYGSPTDFAKTFCKVEKSDKLVDKRTVKRLISHVLQNFPNIKQIKIFPFQNTLVPILFLYDTNLTTPEAVKTLWNQSNKYNPASISNLANDASKNKMLINTDDKTSSLPIIEGVVVSEVVNTFQENVSFSQKLLVSNGFVIPVMTRLKIAHGFLMTLGNDLLTEKMILNKMPLGIFLKVIGCGYVIKDDEWVQQNLSITLENLPSETYRLLIFGAIGWVSNVKNRRIATQLANKLCLLLTCLGLLTNVNKPANNGTVHQYWQINRIVKNSFCPKDYHCSYCKKSYIPMNTGDDFERFWHHLKSYIWHVTESHADDQLLDPTTSSNELNESLDEIQLNGNLNQAIPREAFVRKNWKGMSEETAPRDTYDLNILSHFINRYIDQRCEFTAVNVKRSYSSVFWWNKLECAENLISHYGQNINDEILYKLVSLLWGFDDSCSHNPSISWQKCQQIIKKLLRDGRPSRKKIVNPPKKSIKYIFRSFLITPSEQLHNKLLANCFNTLTFKQLRQLIKHWTLAKIIHKISLETEIGSADTSAGVGNKSPAGDKPSNNITIDTLSKYKISKNGKLLLFGNIANMVELQQIHLCQSNNSYNSTLSKVEMLTVGRGKLVIGDYQFNKTEKRIYSGGLERHYAMIQQPYPKVDFQIDAEFSNIDDSSPQIEPNTSPIKYKKHTDPVDGFNISFTIDYIDGQLNSDYKHKCKNSDAFQELVTSVDKNKLLYEYNRLIGAEENGVTISLYSEIPREFVFLCVLKLAYRIPGKNWKFIASSFASNLLTIRDKKYYFRPKYVTDYMWLNIGFDTVVNYTPEVIDLLRLLGINEIQNQDKFLPTIFNTLTGSPNLSILSLIPLRIYSILRNSPGLTIYEINNKLCLLESCETLEFVNAMIQQGLVNMLVTHYDETTTITYFSGITPNLKPYEQVIEQVINQSIE